MHPTHEQQCVEGAKDDVPSAEAIGAGQMPSSLAAYSHLDPTYLIKQTGASDFDSSFTRYKKEIVVAQTNSYCETGEELAYDAELDSMKANPHYCMQECRKKMVGDQIFSRGTLSKDQKFECYCTETVDTTCNIKTNNIYPQYIVYKYSSSGTSTERLYSPYDKRTGLADSKQCKCPGFSIIKGNAVSCPPNTFSGSGHCSSKCKKCPTGRFSQLGSTMCEKCPAGKILVNDDCSDCVAGKFATASDVECRTCQAGRFTVTKGSSFCDSCPAGYQDDDVTEGLVCNKCAKGKYSIIAAILCTDCPAGYYQTEQAKGECDACGLGLYSTQEAKDDSSCTACDPGRYQNQEGQTSCKGCSQGRYQGQYGKSGCLDCAKGQYQPFGGKSYCYGCPKGWHTDKEKSQSCRGCPSGWYALHDASADCKGCYAGTFSGGTMLGCFYCPNGYYNNEDFKMSCKNCAPSGLLFDWYYAADPDRKSFSGSCDVLRTWPDENTMYWSKSYDCKNIMVGRFTNKGDLTRTKCWTGDSNVCNDKAVEWFGDDCNAWTEKDIYANAYKWCVPPTQHQRND